ncbi:MAG: hypothetical protein WA510_28285 [Acidobacteriaceae bacterium]
MRSIGWRYRHKVLRPGIDVKVLLTRFGQSVLLLAAIAVAPAAWPQDEPALPQLTSEQVVQHLMEKNRERAAALQHYTGRRTYRLEYRGFPAAVEASMEVEVNFDAPSSKHFTIVNSTGSKVIQSRVFRRLLESEEQAGDTNNRKSSELGPENYNFSLAGIENSTYVLNVEPKVESKFLYRGKIWVDARDFAVTRIEAQPARNPSFWTTKSLIRHTYQKIDNRFYLPKENKTVTSVRLGGTATLTIEYQSYQVTAANPVAQERRLIPRSAGFVWPESGISESVAQFVSSAK